MIRAGAIALGKGMAAGLHFVLLLVALGGGFLPVAATAAGSEQAQATTGTNVASAVPAAEDGEGVNGVPSPEGPDFQIRLVTNAAPAQAAATNAAAAAEPSFQWDVSWRGWNGLHLGASQRTPLKSPRELLGLPPVTNTPGLHFEQLKLSVRIGARIDVDGAVYHTDGNFNLPDDFGLRRARLIIQGDSILLFPFSYKLELGYVPHQFNLNQAWISSDRIDYLGYLVIGVYQPPMALDLQTSSRDILFMEPATVIQALAPADEPGIQIGHPVFDQRATWKLGIFAGGVLNSEYGNASENYGNLMGRLTWLAIDHQAPSDQPEQNQILHLGLSANVQYSVSSVVRYRSRPESYLAQYVIDTGNIDASASAAFGLEAAYVNGPFTAQGEFIDSYVDQNNGGGLNFYGTYAMAGWYLTGESRPYDPLNGDFKRLIPRRNFDFGRGGAWGAFQIAARFSFADLTDDDVRGGKIALTMGELNWYLHPHVRWMFNAGGGHVWDGAHDGRILLFQSRVGIDF